MLQLALIEIWFVHKNVVNKIELLQGDSFLMLRTNFPSEFEFPAVVL